MLWIDQKQRELGLQREMCLSCAGETNVQELKAFGKDLDKIW